MELEVKLGAAKLCPVAASGARWCQVSLWGIITKKVKKIWKHLIYRCTRLIFLWRGDKQNGVFLNYYLRAAVPKGAIICTSVCTILPFNFATVTSGHNSLKFHPILKIKKCFGILWKRAIDRNQPHICASIRLEMRMSGEEKRTFDDK